MKWHDNEAYTSFIIIVLGCIVFLLLTGCVNTTAHDAAWELKSRFVYESDVIDTWRELPETGVVSGDCDDFATTIHKSLKDKLGTELWYVDTDKNGVIDHMVAVYDCNGERCIIDNDGAVHKQSHYNRSLVQKVPQWHINQKTIRGRRDDDRSSLKSRLDWYS